MYNRNETSIKIGKIPYANLFPIFYMLQRECDCSGYKFIEGVPSIVNRLLRSGEIDISPSSSIEYLRHKNKYTLIEGHSISSKGSAGSILLLSREPVEELGGKTVQVSSQSETSVALLGIILRKFYKIECSLESTNESPDSLISKAGAFLVIGDEALKAKKTISNFKFQILNKDRNSSLITHHSLPLNIYDLGDLWYRNTGLPFVFALWIARKDSFSQKAQALKRLIQDLQKAKTSALQNFDAIAVALRPLLLDRYSLDITEEELISYWKGISYDLTEEHKKGLELFRKYSEELGLL
jgi:chorismate dehydratase